MKADEEIVESRSRLESVETLLHDERIGPELRLEIRQHFQASKSSNSVDMAALFRSVSSAPTKNIRITSDSDVKVLIPFVAVGFLTACKLR